jgi:hypothetical protein
VIQVVLTTDELLAAATVGMHRHLSCIRVGSAARYEDGTEWSHHIEGAAAEVAVAKHFNLWWSGLTPTTLTGDVGPYHVRHTEEKESLIVRPRDFEKVANPKFIFVTGRNGTYLLIGWLDGKEARRPEWLRNPHGYGEAWFVPRSALWPIQ